MVDHPLDRDAVRAADDAFYAKYPNMIDKTTGERIPLDATSAAHRDMRRDWIKMYEAELAKDDPGDEPEGPDPEDPTDPADPVEPCPNCTVGSVTLAISKTDLTLKHDRESNIVMTVTPSNASVSAQKIEIQRSSGGPWCTLASAMEIKPWKAVIAGKFKIRGVVTVCGVEHMTSETEVEVKFPTYAQIVADGDVQTMTNNLWAQSLVDSTAVRSRELGMWIRLDTTQNKYIAGPRVNGSWGAPSAGASIVLGAPTDNPASPAPCDAGADFYVASFHTHPPTTFDMTPGNWVRPIGPSNGDNVADTSDQVPGVVYDYVESPAGSGSIPLQHPEASAAQLYRSLGVDPRPTPP